MYLNIDNKLTFIDDKRIVGKFDYSKMEEKSDYWYSKDKLLTKYNNLNARLILDAVKDDLLKQNISYLKAYFSGGNDEGGYDSVETVDVDDNFIKCEPFSKKVLLWRCNQHKENEIDYFIEEQYEKKLDFPDDLEEIFYNTNCLDEWGSFAGEFTVNGHIMLNIKTGKWDMQGSESIEQYQDISNEGSI